jgi:hypothetical protein
MIAPVNPTRRPSKRHEPGNDLTDRLRRAELEIQRLDRVVEWLCSREWSPRVAVIMTPREAAQFLKQHRD